MARPQHPFDLSLINLAELKTVFPECSKAARSSQKSMGAASRHGVKIQVLIKKMKEKLNLDNLGVHELLAKIDHRSQDTITWSQFLKFLDNEGVSREVLNDAKIYGFGVKRFEGGPRVKLRSKGSMTDHFIECMQFMEFNDNPLALVIFENRTVQLFNLKNFSVLQNVYFPSKYHLPKQYERSKRAVEQEKEVICRRKDMVMPLSKSGQRRLFKSNRPSTNTSNIVTPTPQPQSVFNLGERLEKEPPKLAKRSSMMQRMRSNQSQQNLPDDIAGSAIMRKMAATASVGKPFGLNADILTSDFQRQESKNEFKKLMEEVDSRMMPLPEIEPNMSPGFLGMTRQNTNDAPSPLQRAKQAMLPAKKLGIRRLKPKMSQRGSIFGSLLSQHPRKATNDNISVSLITPGNVAAALEIRDDDSPRRLLEDEIFTRSTGNRIKSQKYNSQINQLNKCYVKHSSDSAYHQSLRRHQRQRDGEVERQIISQDIPGAFRSQSSVIGGYTEEGAKELDKIKSKRQLSTFQRDVKKKPIVEEQFQQQKQRKDNDLEIHKRIQPVSLAFHSETGLLVISLIDLETIVYQLKQNGASITLKRLYHFDMPFVASTMDIAFHAINSELLLLVVGGREGQFAVYHLDYDLDEDENRKLAEKGSEAGITLDKPLSETIQSTDLKESSSVNSYSKSQNLSQNRGKRFGKPIYKSIPPTKSAEIVKVLYVKEVGVIVASYNGLLRLLEPMKYRDTLSSSNDKKYPLQTITALDYSRKHGLIAMGGVQGKLILYDTMAQGPCGMVTPGNELLGIYFFDEQLQLIALTMNRSIFIYDSNRLECLQNLKDSFHSLISYRSCCFDVKRGNLYTACQFVKIWKAKVDPSIELQVLQISANTRTSGRTGSLQTGIKGVESVLVGKFSTLVATFICERRKQLLTIDSERLVRIFDLRTGTAMNSFNLKIGGRLTAAAVDRNDKFIAVGTASGEVKVFNRSSGGLLYTLSSPAQHEQLEITSLEFLNSISEFWLAGTAWKGKVMMWTAPNPTTNYHVNTKAFIAHHKDVLCLDSCATYVATGASDNIVTVWNAFSGNFRFALQMPDEHYQSPTVVQIKFVTRTENTKGEKSFYLVVVQSNGSVHVIDPSAGSICAYYVTDAGENPRVEVDKNFTKMLAVDQLGKAKLIELFTGQALTSRMGRMTTAKQWSVERVWQAHEITEAQHFTVGVKATLQYSFWLTCTTSGQIKIWSYEGDPISTLCSSWNQQRISMQLFNESYLSPRSQESGMLEDLDDFEDDQEEEQGEIKKTKKISIMSGSLLAEHELEEQNFQFFKEFLREGSPVKNKSKQINNSIISSSHIMNTTAAPTDLFTSFKRKSPDL